MTAIVSYSDRVTVSHARVYTGVTERHHRHHIETVQDLGLRTIVVTNLDKAILFFRCAPDFYFCFSYFYLNQNALREVDVLFCRGRPPQS